MRLLLIAQQSFRVSRVAYRESHESHFSVLRFPFLRDLISRSSFRVDRVLHRVPFRVLPNDSRCASILCDVRFLRFAIFPRWKLLLFSH